MPITLIDPFDETVRVRGRVAPRLDTLAGKTVGLLDISKPGGSIFLDHIERKLKDRYSVARVVRATKPTFTKPAPDDVIAQLIDSGCDAVIEALAD